MGGDKQLLTPAVRGGSPLLGVQTHAHPHGRIEAFGGLGGADGLQFGADLIVCQDREAEVAVEGTVPGNFGEGGESKRRSAGLNGPVPHPVEERSTNAVTLVVGADAHLIDMGVAIDIADDHVPHGLIGIVDGHPGAARDRVLRQGFDGGRLVVGDVLQPDVAKSLPRPQLDLLEHRAVFGTAWSDGDGLRAAVWW